jgi:hypothetical protein
MRGSVGPGTNLSALVEEDCRMSLAGARWGAFPISRRQTFSNLAANQGCAEHSREH